MRNLEQALFTTLGPLVGNRLHPIVVPQDVAMPCIRYTTVSAVPDVSMCGASGLVRSQVQLDILAPGYSEVLALREQVVTAMQSFPLENFLSLEFESYESEVRAFRRILQFNVAEQEA